MDVSNPIQLNAGELRMVQLYRRGHHSNWWTSEEILREFCCTSIRLAFENLVLQNVLSLSTEDERVKVLLIRIKRVSDFLTIADTDITSSRLGLIEQRIVDAVRRNPGRVAADYVHTIVHELLPKKAYNNPGRIILDIILSANRFEYWEVYSKGWLFFSRINFRIDEKREHALVETLNSIAMPVILERNHNRSFREFSERLYKEIYASLENKVDTRS